MRRHKHNRLRKIELLEDRRMKAGDISFDNGMSSPLPARATTTRSKSALRATRFTSTSMRANPVAAPSTTTKTRIFPTLRQIVFNGFAGDDTVNVEVDTPRLR